MITIQSYDLCAPGGRVLLKKFSVHISDGEKVAITGPNGCGKSTLLRQIAGIESLTNTGLFKIKAERISYIPTRPLDLLLPWATVRENIMLFSLISKKYIHDVELKIKSYAEQMLIKDKTGLFLHQKAFELSSGMQALATIFCALIQSPTLLIADEIFSTLSISSRQSMAQWLREQSITIVFASHDTSFINALGARCIPIDKYIP